MITKKPVCVCAVCGAIWLPQPTAENPEADPRKVKRCGTCKSARWNDDDLRVIAKKSAPKEITPCQREKAKATLQRARKVTRDNQRLRRARHREGNEPPAAPELCRHRVIRATCPICRNERS